MIDVWGGGRYIKKKNVIWGVYVIWVASTYVSR